MADIIISSDDEHFVPLMVQQRSSRTATSLPRFDIDISVEDILLKLTELKEGITRHIAEIWHYMPTIQQLEAAWFSEIHRFLPDHIRTALIAVDELTGLIEQIQDNLCAKQLQ